MVVGKLAYANEVQIGHGIGHSYLACLQKTGLLD
jgi:hypothetical protein